MNATPRNLLKHGRIVVLTSAMAAMLAASCATPPSDDPYARTKRMAPVGYGEGYPVADNSTPAGRQLNRRVSILVRGKA